jgi:hypothetical protein
MTWPGNQEAGPLGATPWLAEPRRRITFDCAALVLLALTVAACAVPALSAARPAVLVVGFCLVPGCAALTRLDVDGVAEAATIAIVLSLTLLTAGSLAMVWTGWWHPFAWGALMAGASACLLLVDLAAGALGKWR